MLSVPVARHPILRVQMAELVPYPIAEVQFYLVPEEVPVVTTWYPPYIQLAEQLVEHCCRVVVLEVPVALTHPIVPVVVVVVDRVDILVQVDRVVYQALRDQMVPVVVVAAVVVV